MITNPLAPGKVQFAEYREQRIPEFRGNPFLETLPGLLNAQDMKAAMRVTPQDWDPVGIRGWSSEDRRLYAGGLITYRDPLGIHVELAARLTNLLRWGYVARNPMTPAFQTGAAVRARSIRVTGKGENLLVTASALPQQYWPTAAGLTLLGMTGIGKTVMVESWMKLYPQLYVHTEYNGRPFTHTQVTYLRLQCPKDGSIHGLISLFFQALDALHLSIPMDTGYEEAYGGQRRTVAELIPAMARLAAQHGLGLLIIDEVQELNPRGAAMVLSFLVQMVNTIGVPVVLVGGLDALPLLSSQFRQARRGQTEGDMLVGRAEMGSEFRGFCERLWQYQYTTEHVPLNDKVVRLLYDLSLGITQNVVGIHMMAQERAVSADMPHVTPAVMRSIVKDNMNVGRPVMNVIRSGNREFLRRLPDVELPEGYQPVPFMRADPPGRRAAHGSEEATPAVRSPSRPEAAPQAPPSVSPPRETEVPGTARGVGTLRQAAPAIPHGVPMPDLMREVLERGEDPHDVLVEMGLAGDRLWQRVVGPDAVAALRQQGQRA